MLRSHRSRDMHGMSANATPLISMASGDMPWHVPTTMCTSPKLVRGGEWSGMGGEEAGLGEGGRFAYVYPVGGGRDLGTADG